MVCTLAFVLPIAFVAGIAGRTMVPVLTAIPSPLADQTADYDRVAWTDPDLWPGKRINTVLRQNTAGLLAVEFAFNELIGPDVLVYWVSGDHAGADRLPENAQLLGSLSAHMPLPIPEGQQGNSGHLVLYSLANHQTAAISKAFALPRQ